MLLRQTGFFGAAAREARAPFVGRRGAARARDPDRHDRLRHRRRRRPRSARRQRDALAQRYGVRFRVTRLAVRDLARRAARSRQGFPRTAASLELVAAPDVDVIVEVAGGDAVEPALTAALAAGKPVVTANKALLAKKLAALGMLAQRTETPLLCEAAAAAALPIIRHLSHRADEVDSLMAIVNGTCNYIITRIEQDELPSIARSPRRRRSGLAEADPSADIHGHDAAAKLSILAYRAFGAWVPPHELPVRGISRAVARRLRPRRGDGLPDPADRARRADRRLADAPASSRSCCPTGTCWPPSRRIQRGLPARPRRRETCRCSARAPARCRPRPRCSAI